jgi:phosphoadenosine phosphosulfate reductase
LACSIKRLLIAAARCARWGRFSTRWTLTRSRANLQLEEPFKLPSGTQIRKLNPLADWSTRDVWDYAAAHSIPLLPLYDLGYTSIGCAPCTSLPSDPNDPRSGRWFGHKLECGIHLQDS